MRKRLFEIIEKSQEGDVASRIYDIFMILVILISIFPLCFVKQTAFLTILDKITAAIFIFDYLARIATADFKKNRTGITAFLLYPFHPLAIIDLISILPSITNLSKIFHMLRLFRLIKALRIFRVFRYSKSMRLIINVLKKEKEALLTVGVMAIAYILVTALIVFQIEPYTFDNFFKAIYWAAISLTTVGYGDIYPVSNVGRIISMISSFLGIAIIALPSGIITAGYQKELYELRADKEL